MIKLAVSWSAVSWSAVSWSLVAVLVCLLPAGAWAQEPESPPSPAAGVGELESVPAGVAVDLAADFTVAVPRGLVGRISFSAKVGGFDRIFVLDLDKRRISPLVSAPGNNTAGVWSPNGEQLVFVSDRDGSKELYSVRWDGSDERRLTDTPTVNEDQPSFHPNGRSIVFVADSGGAGGSDGGTNLFTLVLPTGAADVPTPNGRARVVAPPGRNINPRWSPSGDRLAFATNRFWPGWRIALYSPATRSEDFVSKSTGRTVSQPVWSPPGDRLFFADNSPRANAIVMWKLDDKTEAPLSQGPGRHLDPTPSPDNLWLAFTYAPPGSTHFDIFIVNRKDKSIKTLLSSVYSVRHLSWSGTRSIALEAAKVKATEIAGASPGSSAAEPAL